MHTRNHVARNAWKFNKPKAYKAKKGKGSYVRQKKVTVKDYRYEAA